MWTAADNPPPPPPPRHMSPSPARCAHPCPDLATMEVVTEGAGGGREPWTKIPQHGLSAGVEAYGRNGGAEAMKKALVEAEGG
eukprot:gene8062-7440_t